MYILGLHNYTFYTFCPNKIVVILIISFPLLHRRGCSQILMTSGFLMSNHRTLQLPEPLFSVEKKTLRKTLCQSNLEQNIIGTFHDLLILQFWRGTFCHTKCL